MLLVCTIPVLWGISCPFRRVRNWTWWLRERTTVIVSSWVWGIVLNFQPSCLSACSSLPPAQESYSISGHLMQWCSVSDTPCLLGSPKLVHGLIEFAESYLSSNQGFSSCFHFHCTMLWFASLWEFRVFCKTSDNFKSSDNSEQPAYRNSLPPNAAAIVFVSNRKLVGPP